MEEDKKLNLQGDSKESSEKKSKLSEKEKTNKEIKRLIKDNRLNILDLCLD